MYNQSMSAVERFFSYTTRKPVTVITWSLAVMLMVYGGYISSPLYSPDSNSILGLLFATTYLRSFVSALYFTPGLLTVIGLSRKRHSLTTVGTFIMFLAFMFSTILRWLTVGFVPAIWLYTLTLALIAGICYLSDRAVKE